MAQRRKRRKTSRKSSRKKQSEYPGWVWMLFGLAIGLSVAFAIYVKDREPEQVAASSPEPASMQSSIDDNGESVVEEPPVKKRERFEFYKILEEFEIDVDDVGESTDDSAEPQAIEEAGTYILQAGSFSTPQDADRRRAELALHGIESYVQRARVNDRNYHRVYIGPIDDLDELNVTRSRLRAAKIDVMRIRIGD